MLWVCKVPIVENGNDVRTEGGYSLTEVANRIPCL